MAAQDNTNMNTSKPINPSSAVHISNAKNVHVYVHTAPSDDDISFNHNLMKYFQYMSSFSEDFDGDLKLEYADDMPCSKSKSKSKSTGTTQLKSEHAPTKHEQGRWERYIGKVTNLVTEDFPDMCLIEKTNVYRRYVSNTSDSTIELEFRFKGVPHMSKCKVTYKENGEIAFYKITRDPKKLYKAMKDFVYE